MKGQIIIIETADSVMDSIHDGNYEIAAIYIPQKQIVFWEHYGRIQIFETVVSEHKIHSFVGEIEVAAELVTKIQAYLKSKIAAETAVAEFARNSCSGVLEKWEDMEKTKRLSAQSKIREIMTENKNVDFWTITRLVKETGLAFNIILSAVENNKLFRQSSAPSNDGEILYTLQDRKITWRERLAGWQYVVRGHK